MAHPSIYQMYPLAKPPFLIAREGGGGGYLVGRFWLLVWFYV